MMSPSLSGPDTHHILSVLWQSLWHGNLLSLCSLCYLFASPTHFHPPSFSCWSHPSVLIQASLHLCSFLCLSVCYCVFWFLPWRPLSFVGCSFLLAVAAPSPAACLGHSGCLCVTPPLRSLQAALCRFHSTETALTKVSCDLFSL